MDNSDHACTSPFINLFMPEKSPDVIPMISYEDGVAALEWLANAFGFVEKRRLLEPDGQLSHAEMETGNGIIMLGTPTPEYESPKHHKRNCEAARKWSKVPWVIDGVLVYVDNIDMHFANAKKAGASILTGLEDGYPGRRYRVEDIEGHRWMFMQRAATQ
ncbi:MAG: hypothetical protein C5B52_18940 [Bacteroidetes bacterium]|nr:MAG: hypothetical protein C5B52_18940 [Bacteroidota bacterium]